MGHPWKSKKILLTLNGADGQYAIVTREGGGLGITRDSMPIPDCQWHEDEMVECTKELLRRVGFLP